MKKNYKKRIKLILVIFCGVFIMQCTTVKTLILAKKGSTKETNYFEQLDFKYINNYIVCEVKISSKKYNFLFDTGWDITAISKNIANEIDSKSEGLEVNINDSNSKERSSEAITIQNIELGNISFNNIGAAINDLDNLQGAAGCISIDGIIGNNLMRKAKWKINYISKKIEFTDKIENLLNDSFAYVVPIRSSIFGQPTIELKINDQIEELTFDTGSNSKISSSFKIFNQIELSQNNIIKKEGVSIGANSESRYKAYSSQVDLKLDELILEKQIINFSDRNKAIVGNKFLELFEIIIDWESKKIYFKKNKPINPDTLYTYKYNLRPNYKDCTVKIFYSYPNHPQLDSLPKNAIIEKINEYNIANFCDNELCEFWNFAKQELFEKEIILEYRTKESKGNIVLNKAILLPKE